MDRGRLLVTLGLLALASLAYTGCSENDTNESFDGDAIEGDGKIEDELEEPSLPDQLNIRYSREDVGIPLTQSEIDDFTYKVMGFLKRIKYFNYLLDTTYGVDGSTGLKDYQSWYEESFRREGDKVIFFHPENPTHGGHNVHTRFSRVLGNTLAAHLLLPDDPTIARAAQQLCKGFSASMLGMVYDENDSVTHLMSRNVVPAFYQDYLTWDGKQKAVDYSGWFSEYPRWNCNRFEYKNNPYWGAVWVTNVRSKDDVAHIFKMVPTLRYAVKDTENDEVREACAQTMDLLGKFARDIVDNDYVIRTKAQDGTIYRPGYEGDPFMRDYPDAEMQPGDLASYSFWDLGSVTTAQCNAKSGAEYIGYHQRVNFDCGRGEPNWFDRISTSNNKFNRRINRYYHLANLANALVNNDTEAAALLMDGLAERIVEEEAIPVDELDYPYPYWMRRFALFLMKSHSVGFPLTSEEARTIQLYYLKAVDKLEDWPYWDLWSDAIGDGATGSYRPPNCDGADETMDCWWSVANLAQIIENCWSPLVNPTSVEFINCDIVRDQSRWDATVLNEGEQSSF